jgi:hypothetical protein
MTSPSMVAERQQALLLPVLFRGKPISFIYPSLLGLPDDDWL